MAPLLRKSVLLILALMMIRCVPVLSQPVIEISQPILQFHNNTIIIYYDLVSSQAGDRFNVWIDVTDSLGKAIGTTTHLVERDHKGQTFP